MRAPGSWTSSIVGFALAVLLVSWALHELAEVIRQNWVWLVSLVGVGAAVAIAVAVWRHRRDTW